MLSLRSSLSLQGAALAHLNFIPSYDPVLWTDSSVPFGKRGSGVLLRCFFCGTEATVSFSARPVCSSFSAKACVIKQALCWSRQHQQVRHFSFLQFSSYVTHVLSSSLCSLLRFSCYLNLSGRNCFFSPPVLSADNGSPDISFFQETTQLVSLPNGERYSCPLHFFVVFSSYLLYPLITFLGLEAYCLIKILHHTGSLIFHQRTCAPSSRLLCAFSSSLQRTQLTIKLLSL